MTIVSGVCTVKLQLCWMASDGWFSQNIINPDEARLDERDIIIMLIGISLHSVWLELEIK